MKEQTRETIYDAVNISETLSDHIKALLNLMRCSTESVDIRSINMTAEILLTLHSELMGQVKRLGTIRESED